MTSEALTTFEHLPDEILLKIFSFLTNPKDLTRIQFVCSHFKRISDDRELWRNVFCSTNELFADSKTVWKDVFGFVEKLKHKFNQKEEENLLLLKEIGALHSEVYNVGSNFRCLQFEFEMVRSELNIQNSRRKDAEIELNKCKQLLEMQKVELIQLQQMLSIQENRTALEISKSKDFTNQIAALYEQQELDKRSNKKLRKELAEVKTVLDTERLETVKLQRALDRKGRDLERFQEESREKIQELRMALENLEHQRHDGQMKRITHERRMESLRQQLMDNTEQQQEHQKQEYLKSKGTELDKGGYDSWRRRINNGSHSIQESPMLHEYSVQKTQLSSERSSELRRTNRELEKELNKTRKKLQIESNRLRTLARMPTRGKDDHFRALSFVMMAKA